MSKFSAVSKGSSFICVIHLVKGEQFLNATLVSAAMPVTFIAPMHLSSQKDLV